MGNPFLFADRFSGAVVHLTTDGIPAVFATLAKKTGIPCRLAKTKFHLARFAKAKMTKCPRQQTGAGISIKLEQANITYAGPV
jgi:hypothetical protein